LQGAKKVRFPLVAGAYSLSPFQILYVSYDRLRLTESDGVCISPGGNLLGCYIQRSGHYNRYATLSVNSPLQASDVSSSQTTDSLWS
jgi:hypothetical protein